MPVSLEQLEEELLRKQSEVSELEIAVRVLRRMESAGNSKRVAVPQPEAGQSQPKNSPQSGEQTLAGKTMSQCAVAIIKERGPSHYKRIAEMAMHRGYKTPRGATDPETIIQSFWATLNRDKKTFASQDGVYRLRDESTPS